MTEGPSPPLKRDWPAFKRMMADAKEQRRKHEAQEALVRHDEERWMAATSRSRGLCQICGDTEAAEAHRATDHEHSIIALCYVCKALAESRVRQVQAHRRNIATAKSERLRHEEYEAKRKAKETEW